MKVEQSELKKKYQELNNMDTAKFDISKFIEFTKQVIKEYDENVFNANYENIADQYDYLISFFHKYCCYLYGNDTGALVDCDSTASFFNPNSGTITYSKNPVSVYKNTAFFHAFTVFHENRHAVQNMMYYMNPEDILNIDPISIVMLKENILASFSDLYERNDRVNHHDFVMENDANLVAQGYLKDFIRRTFPKNMQQYFWQLWIRMYNEGTSYGKILLNPEKVMVYHFNTEDQDTLPVFYEASKVLRDNVSVELVRKYPLLKLICHQDGTMKSYQEIISDKNRAIFDNQEPCRIYKLDTFSGTRGYEGRMPRQSKQHIGYIYDVIVNSDPILYIEKLICCEDYEMINKMLTVCPQLVKLYGDNLENLLCKYLTYDNYQRIKEIFSEELFEKVSTKLNLKYQKLVQRLVERLLGVEINQYQNEGTNIKPIDLLNSEEIAINSALLERLANGKVDAEKCREYRDVIRCLYDQFRNESRLAYASYSIDTSVNKMEEESFADTIAKRIYGEYNSKDFNLEVENMEA